MISKGLGNFKKMPIFEIASPDMVYVCTPGGWTELRGAANGADQAPGRLDAV